jgi:hypothetical protein
MKTPLFFIAAIAAFFGLPFDFTIMASVLFGAGLFSILFYDYRRSYPRLEPSAVSRPMLSRRERLGLAA